MTQFLVILVFGIVAILFSIGWIRLIDGIFNPIFALIEDRNKKPLLELLSFVPLAVATYFFHELAHYLAYVMLDYEVILRHNTVQLLHNSPPFSTKDTPFIYGSGVVFTFLQCFCAYLILKRKPLLLFFNVLLAGFCLRFTAALAEFFSIVETSDEILLSQALNLPNYTITTMVMISLQILIVKARRKLGLSKAKSRTNIIFFILLTAVYSQL